MELTDVLSLIALVGIITVVVHGIDDRDLWPDPRPNRFELGWPRGVQEEEPVHFRTERVHRSDRDPCGDALARRR